MTHITDLPLDMLYVIFVMIATSDNGARDIVRAGVTCKMLMRYGTLDPNVLKVANFQHLTDTDDFTQHHHRKDLLCLAAAKGNQAAQSFLGKALLNGDGWFWRMILMDYQLAYYGELEWRLVLDHHSLVRAYIIHAPSNEIVEMCQALFNYVIMYAGYNVAYDNGLLCGIVNMCTYEEVKPKLSQDGLEYVTVTFGPLETVVVWLEPPHQSMYRDTVIELFDKLFLSGRG